MTKIVADESMECCTYLNWNPVLLGRHFQYQVKLFLQVIFIDGLLGKKKYHAIRVEFQVRGSSNVHSFLSSFDEYIQFIHVILKAFVPDVNKYLELFH